jgi:cell division protease FtsH
MRRSLLLPSLALAALVGGGTATAAGMPSSAPEPVAAKTKPALDYSQLVAAARAHKVTSAAINDRDHLGVITLKNGTKVTVTLPVDDAQVIDTLVAGGAKVEVAQPKSGSFPPVALFLIFGALLAFVVIFVNQRRGHGGVGNPLARGFQLRGSAVTAQTTDVRFDDVAGCPEAVEELRELLDFLAAPERFHALGAKTPRAALLHGPSGTGKTLLAKALAGEAGIPFYALSGSELVEKFVGVGAARVREIFGKANKEENGAIIFFDEIDAIGRARGGSDQGGADSEREQTLNELLIQLDGFSRNEKVICIAATNRRDILDPALLRPGRFGRQVSVDLPSEQGRREILEVHAKGKPLAADVDLDRIAMLSAGLSGAELAELLNEGAIMAARACRDAISQADLDEGQLRVMLGPERQQITLAEGELDVVAYHEAGHALAAELCPNHENPQKVTVRQRGRTGGLAFFGRKDRLLQDSDLIHEQMVVGLAGRAAEQIIFGKVSSGAANDLEVVNSTARQAVQSLGFSPELGQITSGSGLNRHNFSNETLAVADREVARLVSEAYRDAVDLLARNRAALGRLAELLIGQRDLERVDIELAVGDSAPAAFTPRMGPVALNHGDTALAA